VVKEAKPEEEAKPASKGAAKSRPQPKAPSVEIPQSLAVRQLAELLRVGSIDVIKQLMRSGIMANINQAIDYETAASVASRFGYKVRPQPVKARRLGESVGDIKRRQKLGGDEYGGLHARPPVVTIMGHVDHGKTRLLDAVRKTNVMSSEAGGITQHIGAYQVEVNEHRITFLDTPGHEAFTAMRAHGAQVTDIAILVVAADDGVMPQTLEAIDHARAAGVPIMVAINKIDKPEANPDMVKQQLADAGLVIEEWGGDTICVPISAKEGTGISDLLDNLLLLAEVEELKASPNRPAEGVVVEAKMDKTRGALATVLVHNGTLKVGDTVVVGATWGRVKAMFNYTGKRERKAEPSTPVEILGLSSVPQAGDTLSVLPGERQARDLMEKRQQEMQQASRAKSINLNNLFDQISAGRVKELNIILKADVQGSIDPVKGSLEQLGMEEVGVRIIHHGTGNVTESDVMLAVASKGLVIGFNTDIEAGARRLADMEGVDIRCYSIIYNLVDDVEKALKGMLEPVFVEVTAGRAEVRSVFSSGKKTSVAGVYVTEGKVTRGVSVRVWRGKKAVAESVVASLRRFKDDVTEVATGYECGVGVKDFHNFKEGDVLEFFRSEEAS